METNNFPQSESTPGNDPTQRTYIIAAKVKVAKDSKKQGWFGGKTEFNPVLLVPEQTADQTTMFYRAWLPDDSKEHFEIVMEMGHPIYGTCRGAVLRSSKYYDRPHIFVMSKGVEDILKKKDGARIENIKVLPAYNDEAADDAQETDVSLVKFE